MKIAVCDDESCARTTISDFLSQVMEDDPTITLEEFCCAGDLLSAYWNGQNFDLIFLDVELGDMTGVEAARRIRQTDPLVMLIFTTSHQQYVPEAFILGAFQFLQKPLSKELFLKEYRRAHSTFMKRTHKYRIIRKDSNIVLDLKDILYIETDNRCLRAVTAADAFSYPGKITEEAEKLIPYDFVRCHKAYLVNLQAVTKAEKKCPDSDGGNPHSHRAPTERRRDGSAQ